MSIKDLAYSIKNEETTPTTDLGYFEKLQIELKKKSYNNKSNTYIDTEISEVLSIIKTRGKIPIASLLSFIVESWIKEHKDDIENLPTNKYLQ